MRPVDIRTIPPPTAPLERRAVDRHEFTFAAGLLVKVLGQEVFARSCLADKQNRKARFGRQRHLSHNLLKLIIGRDDFDFSANNASG